jgi:prepilin-type processing-associated H-X9-DG protein
MNPKTKKIQNARSQNQGFALIDLLAVIAVVAALAVTLLPALAGSRPNSQAFQCQNNQRQIVRAWQMYAEDCNDLLPPNDFYSGGGTGSTTPYNGPSRVEGTGRAPNWNWVGGAMDQRVNNSEATNTMDLTTDAALGFYCTNASVYHCPADNSVVSGIGPRVRSVSMNCAVGTLWNTAPPLGGGGVGCAQGNPVGPTWLSGSWAGTCGNNTAWQTYGKLSSISKPSPANFFVITDENPNSINDPVLMVAMGTPDANGNATENELIDIPASYHNGACGFAFADGHSEIHKWLGTVLDGAPKNDTEMTTTLDISDLRWLQARTSATQ